MANHYELLGLGVDATQEEIKSAYRSLAKSFHPDKHPDNPLAAELFVTLKTAYETLYDYQKRADYDYLLNIEWFKELFEQGKLEHFNTGYRYYTRIAFPINISIPKLHIDVLRNEYNPSLEKGGLFLFELSKTQHSTVLILQEIVFLQNISDNPEWQYKPDNEQLNNAISRALTKQLLPCFFHTHPTENENLILESINYNRQMDTSSADKIASLYSIRRDSTYLRLPEFLVIGNGKMKHGLFIGIYGGLVSPLNFEGRKSELMDVWRANTGKQVVRFLDQPWKRALAIAAGTYLLCRYPKQLLKTAVVASYILPPIVYDTSRENVFFGIANHSDMLIKCPGITNEQVRNDEAIIDDLLRHRRENGKAA